MANAKRAAAAAASFDYEAHTPFQIVNLGNKITSESSRSYIERFGVGVIEGRILTKLSQTPDATASQICSSIDLDQAAASRSLRVLEERGYVVTTNDEADNRRRRIALSEAGKMVRDELLAVAHQREALLLTGFSPAERALLGEFLQRLRRNAALLSPDVSAGVPRRAQSA